MFQDAVSIRLPTTTDPGEGDVKPEVGEGQLTVLGHISHRLVVSPDWDSLLRESGLNDTLAWQRKISQWPAALEGRTSKQSVGYLYCSDHGVFKSRWRTLQELEKTFFLGGGVKLLFLPLGGEIKSI